MLKTDEFDYHLPEQLIAQHPAAQRSAARMLVVHREDGRLEHAHVSDMPRYLRPHDLLVVNDTRVIPARIYGHKEETGGRVELLLLEAQGDGRWLSLCKASRRPPVGSTLVLANGRLHATVESLGKGGRLVIDLEGEGDVLEILEREGETPLPPYIKRTPEDARRKDDRERYQTVYAQHPGAVAAPTAGLHFTPELFETLAAQGVETSSVTLHVGIGTFRPVSVDDATQHRMDEERYEVPASAAEAIQKAKSCDGRIVAVGSTTVRTLETVARQEGSIRAARGRSDLFIYPPYDFQVTDVMLTNFHLPKSTLLMMVSALAGRELIMTAYREAVAKQYRFFSYGDAMLIL